jgi:tripartite-type tricarboxylate transporter receptor subunit TctC
MADFKDVPTLRERGVAVDMGPWLGFLAPAGTPGDVVAKIHAAIDASQDDPAVVATMKRMAMVPERMSPANYQAFYNAEYERWGSYIRNANLKLD